MFKPLLRTIPTMSGNVKLACNILNYTEIGLNSYETDIRYAKILPISSSLYQKKIEPQLLGSSWEYDLQKFYGIYNDIFFDSCFKYNTNDILKVDKTVNQNLRNTDFEMGVKRISYSKNGMQFAFFAPFYFESANDLPGYFEMSIHIYTAVHSVTKTVKINIMNNSKSKTNYLCHYLSKYAKNIDSNVCFLLPESKQAAFYGIDLVRGGFVKSVDNGIANLYSIQTTINNFDATICTGFKRNKIAMKQVMPLSFYFNITDIMTASELKLYRNANIEFSGHYVTQQGIDKSWYDFNIDYDYWKESVLKLNSSNGLMIWTQGDCTNIMDTSFPSLNDMKYVKYQFSNKLTSTYCRWKLKYSSDEHPYITNMSPAFSKNQTSNYKYAQYPVSFSSMDGLALPHMSENGNYYYNLIFPLSTNIKYYDLYNGSSATKYKNIFNNYCLNWFNVVENIDDKIFNNQFYWKNVTDDCVYYNGILYDLSNIYSELVDPIKIDKFGVFVRVNHKFMSEEEIGKLKFAENTLIRQFVNKNIYPNALSNLQLLNWSLGDSSLQYKNFLYNNEEYIGTEQTRGNKDSIEFNTIFTYSETNTGNYIDFADYGLDYYKLNRYYDYNQISSYINDLRDHFFDRYRGILESTYDSTWHEDYEQTIIDNNLMHYIPVINSTSSYIINSYELLPIYRSYDLSYFDGNYDKNKIRDYMYSYGYSYMLNLNEYVAYEHKHENNDTYMGYYYQPIEGKYDVYGNFTEGSDYELNFVSDNLYLSNLDDYGVKKPSCIKYVNSYSGVSSTYFSSGKQEYVHMLHGNTFYNKRKFIKGSYLGCIEGEPYSPTYLKAFYDENADEFTYHYEQILEEGTPSYALYKTCQHVQEIAADMINAYINNTQHQYVFNPVIQSNGTIYASNVFTECFENTGKFYGNNITYSQVKEDKNVIYAARYNLNDIFKLYSGLHSYTYNYNVEHESTVLTYTYSYNYSFTYDWVYNVVNSTYEKEYTHYNKIPETISYNDMNDGTGKYFGINLQDYSEFYAKFLSKDHVYYWYTEISKDENREFIDENWAINWKNYIYIKRRVLAHTNDGLKIKDEFIPLVDAGYMFIRRVNPDWFLSFKEFYAHIHEGDINGLFYFDGCEGEKFELAFKDIFFRVNKTLWDIIGCQNETWYKDIYLYRIEDPSEYSKYETNDVHIRYVSHDFWNSYSSHYSDNLKKNVNYYHDPDSALTPLFYDIFEQTENEEAIYANYQLNNISTIQYNYPVEWDEKKEHVTKYRYENNYRYNSNDSKYMIIVSDEEREKFGLTKTYKKYSYCDSNLSITTNDLNYKDSLYMSTYTNPVTGVNYGFYVIDVYIDNTSNSFRVDGQTSLTSKSNTSEVYEYLNNIKNIQYINGIDIVKNPQYAVNIFKNIAPFININLLTNINRISTVIKPGIFNIDMIYNQQLLNNTNNSSEINIYIDNTTSKYTKKNLYRYTHNIVPYITERSILSNYYYLKLKNVDTTLLNEGKYNSIGDSILYKKTIDINTFNPYNVYTISPNIKEVEHYNNIDYKYTPLEYKHFNASKFLNLETEIVINLDGKYTYEELIELEKDNKVIEIFAGYLNTGRVTKFTDEEILFLFKKYKVEYDSKSIGLNFSRSTKLYSLTYKFSLL